MPGTVTVACKLPHGLILQLQRAEEVMEPVMGGGTRKVTRFVREGGVVTIRGFSRPAGTEPGSAVQGGYGLTPGVDADFFTKWVEQNKDMEMVREGLIFAHEKPAEVEKFARDNRSTLSGLEAANPAALPPEFKRHIKTAEVA